MITLFASIVGFISSIIPEILKMVKDRNDKRYELDMLDKRLELSSLSPEKRESHAEDWKNYEAVMLYSTYNTGVGWVDALNGTVRPLLAYSFFTMYAVTKYMQYKMIAVAGFVITHLEIMWSLNDQAIFASITSFYFGQRTFNKVRRRVR